MTTATEKTASLLATVLADLTQVVGGISTEHLHDPTPCTEWDVEQLRDHVVGWLATFAAGFADPGGQAPRASLDGYQPPADPVAETDTAADTLLRAVRGGAVGRPLRLGDSAMPGDMALSMILWEYQVHGWDLARATGQPWSPPAEAAAASLSFAPAMLTGDYQGDGKPFANQVPVPESAAPRIRAGQVVLGREGVGGDLAGRRGEQEPDGEEHDLSQSPRPTGDQPRRRTDLIQGIVVVQGP